MKQKRKEESVVLISQIHVTNDRDASHMLEILKFSKLRKWTSLLKNRRDLRIIRENHIKI